MESLGFTVRQKAMPRALAVLGCLALLYLASGAAVFHKHTNGPETSCHICQTLHLPALAATSHNLIPGAQQTAWHASLPQHAAPSDSFSFHRASRAPPTQTPST